MSKFHSCVRKLSSPTSMFSKAKRTRLKASIQGNSQMAESSWARRSKTLSSRRRVQATKPASRRRGTVFSKRMGRANAAWSHHQLWSITFLRFKTLSGSSSMNLNLLKRWIRFSRTRSVSWWLTKTSLKKAPRALKKISRNLIKTKLTSMRL